MIQFPRKESRLWRFASASVIVTVATASKIVIGLLNKTHVYNHSNFVKVIGQNRHKPLITVSNHYSMVDDCLLQYLTPWKWIFRRSALRWLPGAHDVCFRSQGSSLFFLLGKVIPVVRGDGVYQPIMNFCVERLNDGEWVHMFPEGQVNLTQDFMRLKWGVGRLIADSKICPIVLPYWASGMEDMFPTKKPYHPRMGHTITVYVGEPMDIERDLVKLRVEKRTDEEIRKYVTDKIQDVLARLKAVTEEKHLKHKRGTSKISDDTPE